MVPKKMKLNIGCGHVGTGDVNIDLHLHKTIHRIDGHPLQPKLIKNFVCADAHHLPFKSEVFDETYSKDVIEHVSNPYLMMKEMFRVTKAYGIVHIIFPHKYAKKLPEHINYFNSAWFWKVAKKLGAIRMDNDVTRWRYFPFTAFPLFQLPLKIELQIVKG